MSQIRGHELLQHCEQGAPRADQHGRQYERHKLVAAYRIADERGALLVVPDRLQHLAERGIHHAPGEVRAGEHHRCHQDIEAKLVSEVDAERRAALNSG